MPSRSGATTGGTSTELSFGDCSIDVAGVAATPTDVGGVCNNDGVVAGGLRSPEREKTSCTSA